MPELKPFKTSDIDLIAAILTDCDEVHVPVTASPGQRLVEFCVDRTERIEKVIYSSGGLCQNIRMFSRQRAKLYKAAQQVSASGWEVLV